MYEDILEKLGEESRKCISCGFCDSVCPTYESSGRDPSITARGRAQLGKRLHDDIVRNGSSGLYVSDSFYSCLDCHACVHICPTGVDAGKVSDLGKMLITSGRGLIRKQERPEARMIVSATMKFGNPLGVREKCAEWSKGLTFQDDSKTVLYTGNMYQLMAYSRTMKERRELIGKSISRAVSRVASRMPSVVRAGTGSYDEELNMKMTRSLRNIVNLLQKSGVAFAYMGEDEPYPGTFLHDLGYYSEFSEYAQRISKMFRKGGFERIITLDPHTQELLKEVYPKYVDDFDFEVVYYLDLVDRSILGRTEREVVFHEPCRFVLGETRYNVPLEILTEISNVSLPERSGKRTVCCGGPSELLFGNLADSISSTRFGQLKETGKSSIVTACPICYANLAKDESVIDISDILSLSAGPKG